MAGVVGGLVLPAVPDDEEPGAGEDAGFVVEPGGPGAGVVGVGGGAAGRGGQAGVQDGGAGAAAVADAGQPGCHPPGREPVGAVLGAGAGQEAQADRGVDAGVQPGRAGKALSRWARSWLARATRWLTRSLRARQARRRVTVAGLSGVRGASRARSVRSVPGRT